MNRKSLSRKTMAAVSAAFLAAAPLSGALAASQSSAEDQESYSMSMKAELAEVRERVAAVEGDSALQQAWDEVAGDWGRLQLATQDEWEDAKGEFVESWEYLKTQLEEAEM
ncbi:MAG: hypothetical protein P8X75_00570 [Limibacillus sp.]|jgi:hypothetical protein